MSASVEQVGTLLQREITDELEQKQIEAWIQYAEMLIRKKYPRLDALVSAGRISQEAVDAVEAQAVARHSLNPEGATSRSTRIDDYQETVGMTNSREGIFILDSEWLLLVPDDVHASGAFTIRPAGRRPSW